MSAKQEPVKETVKSAEPPVQNLTPKQEEKHEEKPKQAQKEDFQKSLRVAEIYTKKEEFEKAIEIYKEILAKDPENLLVQQKLREVYSFQEKKLEKIKHRSTQQNESDKITTEDILVVMKGAVQEEDTKGIEDNKEKKLPATSEKTDIDVLSNENKAKEIEKVLKDITNTEGIVGGLFLQKDGKILTSVLPPDIDLKEISQDIARIVAKTEKSVLEMKQGKLNHVIIASESGQLLFTEIGNGVLFMIGNEKMNMGKMSYVLKDVVVKIKTLLNK